jgi:hypothetical protein
VLSHTRDIVEERRPQVCEDILSELKSAARARFRKHCTCTMATHPPQAYQIQPLTAVACSSNRSSAGALPSSFPRAQSIAANLHTSGTILLCTLPQRPTLTPGAYVFQQLLASSQQPLYCRRSGNHVDPDLHVQICQMDGPKGLL